MNTNVRVIHDSGRFPLWFRLPAAAFGIFAFCVAVRVALGLFGFKLGLKIESGVAGGMAALIGLFFISYIWTLIWIAQVQIDWDESKNLITLRKRRFRGWHKTEYPTTGVDQIIVRACTPGVFSGRRATVFFHSANGQSTELEMVSNADAVAKALSDAMLLPLATQS